MIPHRDFRLLASFLFSAYVLTLCAGQTPANSQKEPGLHSQSTVDLNAVFTVWKNRQDRVRSGRFEWIEEMTLGQGAYSTNEPPQDTTNKCNILLLFDGDKVRYEAAGPSWSGVQKKICDSRYITTNNNDVDKALFDALQPSSKAVGFLDKKSFIQKTADTFHNLPMFLQFRPFQLRDYVFDSRNWRLATDETAIIDGEKCIVIISLVNSGSNTIVKMYVSMKKEFSVGRIESTTEGRVTFREDIGYANMGEWVPSRWTGAIFGRVGQRVVEGCNASLSTSELNEMIDPQMFNLVFPTGTSVTDSVEKTRYIIMPNNQKKYTGKMQERAPTVRSKDRRYGIVILVNLLLLLALILWGVRRAAKWRAARA